VVDLGMASTDLLYFAAGRLDAPGAMFTASHNPPSTNGIKLCLSGARPIGRDTASSRSRRWRRRSSTAGGPPARHRSTRQRWLRWRAEPARRVRRPTFARSSNLESGCDRLKVVADTANGMGGLVAPKVFAPLPFDVEILFPELDGNFPNHPADPIQPENLTALKAPSCRSGADVGLAFDGDADRVFLVDEQAEPVSGSLTTALVAASMPTSTQARPCSTTASAPSGAPR